MADPLNPYKKQYQKHTGPGDARPTALQIIKDERFVNGWQEKVVLVTCGTSGIGIQTVRALHATGADVYFTARDASKGQATLEDIRKSSEGNGRLAVVDINLDSLDSVKKGAQQFLQMSDRLNILVNNAGIMATPEGSTTADGFELQFGVNQLAHFVLTALLLPTLIKSSSPDFNSRVIAVTSGAHRLASIQWDNVNLTKSPNTWTAYAQSKTANAWMANYIDRVYGPRGVHANSIHPGLIWTGLQATTPVDFIAAFKRDEETMKAMMTAEQGAATTVWAATAKVWEGKGGKYLTNCSVAEQTAVENTAKTSDPGYAGHAYDVEGEDRLWKLSEEITGIKVSEV